MRATATMAVVLAGGFVLVYPQPTTARDHGPEHMEKCAKACADCMKVCEMCHAHCMKLLAEGKKEHHATAAMTADCADICAAAGRSVARSGPLHGDICEACMKACEKCGAECEKFPDEHMKKCAAACKECAAACKAMLGDHKHAGK